jgi:peptidoglycan/LPS O-acetylase OafA/YrhL
MITPVEKQSASSAAFLGPYQRITSGGHFIPEIDGLRFVAIFSVFIYHLAGDVLRHSQASYPSTLRSNGLFLVTQVLNIGVPLFFVISGFILSLPFAQTQRNLRRSVSLKNYFWRRVTRLEPPYTLCLLLFFVLKIAGSRGTATGLLPNLVASIFYVHNQVFERPSDIDFVAWSLEIEIQFYILVPLLACVFAISRRLIRRSVLVAAVLLASSVSALVSSDAHLKLSLLGYAQYFLIGFLLAEIYLGSQAGRTSWLWDGLSIAGWCLLLFLLVGNTALSIWRIPWLILWCIPWLILLLYIAAFRGPASNLVFTNHWITTIGGMCYSIYLLHNYIIAATGWATERLSLQDVFAVRLLIQFLLIAPVVLVVSALYFRFIERPCMRPNWPQQLASAVLRTKSRRFAWAVRRGH